MALIDDVGAGPVGVDTVVFIYFIEENEQFLPVIAPLFDAAEAGKLEIVVSALTLLEVLVVPYRAGNVELARIIATDPAKYPGVMQTWAAMVLKPPVKRTEPPIRRSA